ncbi:hypothetical protein D3C72_1777040 [compost metagenome]
MDGLGDDAPGVEGGAPPYPGLAPKHRLESVVVEVVLYVRRGQLGDPVPLPLPLEQGAGGARVLGTRLVAVGEQVPLNAKVAGHLDEGGLATLGELYDAHPFRPQAVAADLGELGEQPDLCLPLHQ